MTKKRPVSNPFPGLPPFEPHQSHLFFGRDEQVEELLIRLGASRFLAVVGRSGSGKSSLVRAGLLPALYGGFMAEAGSGWNVCVLRPGDAPIKNLAEGLGSAAEPEASADESSWRLPAMLEVTLRRSQLGVVQAVREKGLASEQNLLIVVDQFEELFRFRKVSGEAAPAEDAAAFVKLLLEASRQSELPIYVVLTMRSDFLGECSQFPDLPEAINDGQFLIPRLNRDQHRLAIEGPAAVAGGSVSPRLVNRLLNEVESTRDQLPILQHALMRTWEHWSKNGNPDEPIDLANYEASGGMEVGLSLHVEERYLALDSDEHRWIADKLFRILTERGTENRGIRRPSKLGVIAAVVDAPLETVIRIVDVFRIAGCSFLMPPVERDLDADTVIDISHESLMRVSERLKKLVLEESDSATVFRRLVESASLFDEGQAGPVKDPELSRALEWFETARPNVSWARLYTGVDAEARFASVSGFLQKSVEARDADSADKARQVKLREDADLAKRREKEASEKARRSRWLATVMSFMLLLSIAASLLAVRQTRVAERQRQRAEEQTLKAQEQIQVAEAARDRAEQAAQDSYDSVASTQEATQDLIANLRSARDNEEFEAIASYARVGGEEILDLSSEIRIEDPVTLTYLGRSVTLSKVSLNGRGNAIRVAPAEQVRISFLWSVETDKDMYCPGCVVQLYFGIDQPGGALQTTCFSDSIQGGSRAEVKNVFKAPARPGRYYVRLGGSTEYGCKDEKADYTSNERAAKGRTNSSAQSANVFAVFEVVH